MHPDVYLELFEDEMGLDTMGLTSFYPALIETIQKKTLPVFSELFPCVYPYLLDPNDMANRIPDAYAGSSVEYRINDPMLDSFGLKVLSYKHMYPAYKKDEYEKGYQGQYLGGIYGYGGNMLDDMLIGNIQGSINSKYREVLGMNPVCKLKGTKLLELKHFADFNPYIVELIITYPNVNSIQETFKRYFLNLAKFEVGIYLYNKLKYMEDIVTPAGNVNLRISDWEGYPRERDDYITQLRELTFPDRVDGIYYLSI